MPRAYSVDRRERSLRALTSGMPAAEVARLFDVSLSRWQHRQRERGDLVPARSPGRPRAIPGEAEAALHVHVPATPDATLAALGAQWATPHGTRVSPATMCRTLARLGLPRKTRR